MSGIHSQILHHIAKRGVAVVESNRNADLQSPNGVAPWAIAVFFLTVALFIFVYASVRLVNYLQDLDEPANIIIRSNTPSAKSSLRSL